MQRPVILAILAQQAPDAGPSMGALIVPIVIALAVLAILIASGWKIFEKAGKPGWASLIPIYNMIVYLEIVNRPLWWIILFFIPCANIVVAIVLALDLAKAFGKDTLFAVGLLLLGIIFYPLLAFGDATYRPITR